MRISPGSVIARIWEIYRDQTVVLVGTAALLFAISSLVLFLLPGASIAVTILFWALTVLYEGMVVELVRDVETGRRHSVGDLLRSVEPVLLQLMAVSILYAIGVAIGFILIVIPGLILLTLWAVVAPVTVLERPGVLAAFGRSRELVRGNGWNVFAVIAIVGVILLIVSFIVEAIAASVGSLGGAIILWALQSAVAPVTALAASVLYFSLRPAAP